MAIHVYHNRSMNKTVARQLPKGQGKKIRVYVDTRLLGLSQPGCSYCDANVKVAQTNIPQDFQRRQTKLCAAVQREDDSLQWKAKLPNTDRGNRKPLNGLSLQREKLQQLNMKLVTNVQTGEGVVPCSVVV